MRTKEAITADHFNTTLVKVHQDLPTPKAPGAGNFNTTLVKVHRGQNAPQRGRRSEFQYNPC